MNNIMHRKHAQRIFGIWEKSESWGFASEEEGWLSELAEALWWVPPMVRGRWKSQHRKIVYHSPYVEKPFYSKVIKSFVPELRSRKCFVVFRDSYVIYIWVMNILCTFHLFMCRYVTFLVKDLVLHVFYIDLQPGRAVKIGNAPM